MKLKKFLRCFASANPVASYSHPLLTQATLLSRLLAFEVHDSAHGVCSLLSLSQQILFLFRLFPPLPSIPHLFICKLAMHGFVAYLLV